MTKTSSRDIINELNFCVIDLETTGGNHAKDKIIEIGMVKVKGTEIKEEKNLLINPEKDIPEFIQKLTGISQKDVKNAAKIEDVIEEIIDFIDDDIIVAHNTSFDVPFLNGVLKNLDKPELTNNVVCTNVMTKHLIPEILNSNLTYMSKLFKIDYGNAHRASDDAKAAAQLLITYLEVFIEKGIKKVNQLYYPRNKFELDRVHFEKKKSDTQDVIDCIKKQKSPIVISVKGVRGLILATIPLESPKDETNIVTSILEKVDWELITIRLVTPMLEALLQFCSHYQKYDKAIQDELTQYLGDRYDFEDSKIDLEKLDFVIAPHLIQDQVLVYSFLSLTPNSKGLFKIPAQKKKLYQHLLSQINRFENNQKGKRKNFIPEDLKQLIQNYLARVQAEQKFLYLNRKEVKQDKDRNLKIVVDFVTTNRFQSDFPINHL